MRRPTRAYFRGLVAPSPYRFPLQSEFDLPLMHIISLIGARPQFIKAAVVSKALAETGAVEELVHTGQYHDDGMSGISFDELGIPKPAHNLGVGSGSHGAQTGEMMMRLEEVALGGKRPDWMLLYGDTNSTLAGALVSSKLDVPVAHVEVGLRSFNRLMPEEINRVLTDHVSKLLFCPTETACRNLQVEGVTEGVVLSGDVMYESTYLFGALADASRLPHEAGSYGPPCRPPRAAGEDLRGFRSTRHARRATAIPTHARSPRRCRSSAEHRVDRPRRLPRHTGAYTPGSARAHGFGRAPERSVLARNALCDDARRDRVGRDAGRRLELDRRGRR